VSSQTPRRAVAILSSSTLILAHSEMRLSLGRTYRRGNIEVIYLLQTLDHAQPEEHPNHRLRQEHLRRTHNCLFSVKLNLLSKTLGVSLTFCPLFCVWRFRKPRPINLTDDWALRLGQFWVGVTSGSNGMRPRDSPKGYGVLEPDRLAGYGPTCDGC